MKQNFFEFNRIGSKKLNVYTIHQKKLLYLILMIKDIY